MGRTLGDPDRGENMYGGGCTDLQLIRTKESVCSSLWFLTLSFWPMNGGQWLPASHFLAESCWNAPK